MICVPRKLEIQYQCPACLFAELPTFNASDTTEMNNDSDTQIGDMDRSSDF